MPTKHDSHWRALLRKTRNSTRGRSGTIPTSYKQDPLISGLPQPLDAPTQDYPKERAFKVTSLLRCSTSTQESTE